MRAVGGDGVRDRAQVVRGHRHPHGRRGAASSAARERLEGAVGLGLVLEDGRLPAVLAGGDDLVVPVGALDEAHDERVLAPERSTRPGDQAVGQLGRVAQVGLQDASRPTGRRRTRPRPAARARGRSPPRASRRTPCRCAGGRRARAAWRSSSRSRAGGVAAARAQGRRRAAAASAPRPSRRGSRAGAARRRRARAPAAAAAARRPPPARRAPRGSGPRSGRPPRR